MQRVITAGEQQVATALDKTPFFPARGLQAGNAVALLERGKACRVRVLALLETPDRTVWGRIVEQVRVAEIDEVGDRPGSIKQSVERHRRSRLEQIARGDENQLAAGFEEAQALLDEEQVEIGTAVEHRIVRQPPRTGVDVLVADVGRIADDRGKTLVVGQLEKIHHFRTRWRVARINLDAERAGEMLEERTVATSRLEHTTVVAHQRPHAVDDG